MILISDKTSSLGETFEQDTKNKETIEQRLTVEERTTVARRVHSQSPGVAVLMRQKVQLREETEKALVWAFQLIFFFCPQQTKFKV